jgi:carbonic anhydrase
MPPPIVDELLLHAQVHRARFPGPHPVEPQKKLAIVACMDSRIDIFSVFGLGVGEAHVIRNAGGLITDDVLRSLVLSQRALGTRAIVLLHHTDCGLMKIREREFREAIVADTGLEPPYEFGAFTDVDESVRRGIARVREHPFLPHRDVVRGFVYEVETGVVREVDPAPAAQTAARRPG